MLSFHSNWVSSENLEIHHNSKQTLMNNAVNNKALRKPIHSPFQCQVNHPSRKPLDLQNRTGAMPEQHSLHSQAALSS